MCFKINNRTKQILKNSTVNLKFKIWICMPAIFMFIILDNWTKISAINNLSYDKEVKFIPHFINFCLIYNKGSAYGSNSNHFILTISLAILITMMSLVLFFFFSNKLNLISLSLIAGGGLGNLISRTWNSGLVTDFLTWELFTSEPQFIFNLADFFICTGIALLIISVLIFEIILDLFLKRRYKY